MDMEDGLMVDPAIREKAKELFVENGFSMDTIVTMLAGQASRKSIYNFRKEDNWVEERVKKVSSTKSRRERLEQLLDKYITEAEAVPSPKLIFAIGKIVAALRASSTFEFTEERQSKQDNKSKGFTEETLKEIESKILGMG
jgi:hypothetical protein